LTNSHGFLISHAFVDSAPSSSDAKALSLSSHFTHPLPSDPNASGGSRPSDGILGVILGSVSGGLVLVLLVLFVVFRLRRTKPVESASELEMGPEISYASGSFVDERLDTSLEYENPETVAFGTFADVFAQNTFDEMTALAFFPGGS
jgi:hypothetical protein